MTPRKETVYFLTDKSNLFYSLEDGAVTKNAVPKPIDDNPIGANDLQLAFGTNNKYWSLNRSFTVPLTFVNDGCDILRFLVYNGKGYEEEVYLYILQWNNLFVDPDGKEGRHELLFKGKIDFTKLKDDPTTGVTVNVIEGGLLSYLNANDGVTYEIPCNAKNPDCIKVKFDGIYLQDRYKFSFINYELSLPDHTIAFAVPLAYLSNEGDSVGIITGSPSFEETTSSDTYAASSSNYFFSSATAGSFPISGKIIIQTGGFTQVVFNLRSSTGKIIGLYNDIPPANQNIEININQTLTCDADEKWFLMGVAFGGINIKFLESFFYVSSETINPPSISYALQPLKLGKALLSKMTDGRYTMESNFLSVHNNIVAAGGESIRGITEAVLKTSFQDFYNSYNAVYNLGVKVVDNVLWIEPKKDLYNDSTDILDMGEVSQFSIGFAEEYLVNSVKIGYPVQDYGERNGRFEFNDTIEEKLPVTAVNKELNLVSKYRGDSYGIEFNRGKLNNADTTDNKGDNEVFLINVDNTVFSEYVELSLSKSAATGISGTISFDDVTLATGGVEDYVTYNGSKSTFTYINETTQKARISFFGYGTKTGLEGSFVLNVNGVQIASDYIQDFQTTFRASITQEIILKKGDVISIQVTMLVDLISAGIDINILQVNSVQSYVLKRVTYDNLTGVPTPTVYNVEEMTPKRMLLAHGNYLRSLLYQLPGEKITFQTADKNKDLSTTYNGLTITEKEDILVTQLADPLFLPYELSLTTKVPFIFPKVMRNPIGHIKFTYNNFPLYCLLIGDMKCKPVSDEAQEWKLLASPLNSLDTLLKLSQGAIIIQDYMNNQIIISDLNPVHFVRYDCVQTPDRTFVEAALPPTGNQGLVAGVQNASWNSNGAKIYARGFNTNGLGTEVAHLTTPHFWVNGDVATEVNYGSPTRNLTDGRMNQNGIWVQGNVTPGTTWMPVNEWIGFSRKVTVSTPKTIYLGISGDSWVRLSINGSEIINTIGSNLFVPSTGINCLTWSIYPIDLSVGENFIEMSVMNGGAPFVDNPAGFACEMYDMNLNQLLQARTESDLNIIFRTKDMIGQPFDIGTTIGYSCNDGWVLQKDDAGVYTCVKTIKGNDCTGDHTLNKRYHFKGIYDDRFEARLDRYDSKAKYYQKWQTNDLINLQFITVGYGALQLEIYDCQTSQIAIIKANVIADTSLQSPYIKQEFALDLAQFGSGVYQFVISINGVKLVLSEWQQVSTDLPDTLLIEYYNTSNKPDAYFKTWRPSIRIEAFMPPPTPESTSTTYEDQPGDTEILSGTAWMKQKFILGDGYGMPDYMAKKLNRLLLLNRVYMDGTEYTKAGDAKLETVELVEGYPMNYYTVEMRESLNAEGLVISDVDLKNSITSTLTLDAEAFGGAPGTIQIEID